jgi:hypothetical protein
MHIAPELAALQDYTKSLCLSSSSAAAAAGTIHVLFFKGFYNKPKICG